MPSITVISDRGAVEVPGDVRDGRVLLAVDDLPPATGWRVEPQGLCHGDRCVPVLGGVDRLVNEGGVDLVAVAAALDKPLVVDAEARAAVLGVSRADRLEALVGKQLPLFELPDLGGGTHASSDWRGRKTLLVAFASW